MLVADKGYHARKSLKALEGGVGKTRIAEPEPANGYLRWHGRRGGEARGLRQPGAAEIGNRARAMRRRGELVERGFALSSIAAACVAHGCADTRIFTSAI